MTAQVTSNGKLATYFEVCAELGEQRGGDGLAYVSPVMLRQVIAVLRAAPETGAPRVTPAEVEQLIHWHDLSARLAEQSDNFGGACNHRDHLREWKTYHARLVPSVKSDDDLSVMGGASHPAPMPSVDDAIAAHVREIQILCDFYGRDPTQWLNDCAAQGCW